VREGEFAETALRVFIENARLNPGVREPVQKEMSLRQIRRAAQSPQVAHLTAGSGDAARETADVALPENRVHGVNGAHY
jgi:hypothetical protein